MALTQLPPSLRARGVKAVLGPTNTGKTHLAIDRMLAHPTGIIGLPLRLLAREGRGGMITLPGDIPAATSAEIDAVLAAHLRAPSFTISPAHDDLGSNAVICSPPDSVPLRFGENSYFPHLEAARRSGIEPTVIRQPGIAMDIDHPVDLAMFLRLPQSAGTRTRAFLEEAGIPRLLIERGIG